jgi:hypothetical protein
MNKESSATNFAVVKTPVTRINSSYISILRLSSKQSPATKQQLDSVKFTLKRGTVHTTMNLFTQIFAEVKQLVLEVLIFV